MLALDALGIGPGDEVICPAFTFFATAEAIARRGATPVFADIDPVTLNLDPAEVERADHRRGRRRSCPCTCSAGRRRAELRGFGLPLIEDAAQAFGAHGIATSVASTFSFFPTKNLFALGDGGLIAVNDAELAERIRMLRFHGSRAKKEFEYIGYNSRLDAMQAAVLRIFLPHLDEWNAPAPRGGGALRRARLGELVELPQDEPGHVYHMYCVRSPERDRLAAALTEAGDRLRVVLPTAAAPAAGAALPRLLRGRLPGDREGRARESLPAAVGRDHGGAAGPRSSRAAAAPRASSRR